jgi:hypothetical protein
MAENRAKSARVRAIRDYARTPENASAAANRQNLAKPIRARFR